MQKLMEIPCVVLSFVITVGASIWLDPLLMVGMLISAIIMAWAMSKTSKNIESTMKEYSDSTQQYSKVTNEYMEGFRLLFSSDLISYAMKVHQGVNEKREQMNYNKDKTQYKAIYSAQYIGLISTIVMMLLAIYFVAIGRISAGMVIAVSQLAGKMVSPFQSLSEIKVAMTSGRVIEKELQQILMLPKGENGNIEKSEFRDAIVLNNLSYCYPEGTEDTLSNISYKFEKGKKYAIVGPSGSGKTTLMSLLLGFHADYKGEVLVDNVELKEIDKRKLYKTIGTVPTDIFIFDTSLQENIALFQDVSEKKMHQALKDSCLLEGDKSLGKGNLNLSYKGNNVSSGERKRIGLARLLYHEYDVYLLDEFSANLDVDTADKIENNILARKDNMIISITHKLGEHLAKYDEIIVMQSGMIAEHGTYEELLDKKGVLYSMEKVG